MKYIDDIEARKAELAPIIQKALTHLKFMPEGHLRYRKDGNTLRFYWRRSNEDINGKYLSLKEDGALVHQLAQKMYLERMLRAAVGELTAIERGEVHIRRHLPEQKMEEVLDGIDPGVRLMIMPIIETDEQYATRWQYQPYKCSDHYESEKKHSTKRGEKVRSKSERLIANILFDEWIPYKYECPLIVGEKTLYPDFTILDKRTRRVFYWEHFGMVDNTNYAVNACSRLSAYCAAGDAVWGNLIVTFEADKVIPFDHEDVLAVLACHGLISPERLTVKKAV